MLQRQSQQEVVQMRQQDSKCTESKNDIGINSTQNDWLNYKRVVYITVFMFSLILLLVFLIVHIHGGIFIDAQDNPLPASTIRQLQHQNLRNANQIKNKQLSLSPLDHPLDTYHNHQPFILSYQSIGMPKQGLPFNNQPIPIEDYLAFELLQAELFKPHGNTNCQFQSYGTQQSKTVLCKNFISKSQAIFNFGVKRGDSVSCTLTRQFRLRSFEYGCNCDRPAQCSSQLSSYHQLCLSQIPEITKDNMFTTLKKEIDEKGYIGRHIILKIDVGGAEWMSLKTLPIQYLTFIDQLIIKFHNPRYPQITPPLKGYQNIIKTLTQKFASVNMHLDNNECVQDYQNSRHYKKFRSTAIEVTLVNRRLLTIRDESRLYLTNFKNSISTIFKPDCQMNDSD